MALMALSTCLGPIPACAGEPLCARSIHSGAWAYPRMRGGTGPKDFRNGCSTGLSPHARGNQRLQLAGSAQAGPIPACAGEPFCCFGWCQTRRAYPRMRGEPLCPSSSYSFIRAYPRMRGGTVSRSNAATPRPGLSPHARGNLNGCANYPTRCGPIPACAGEPATPSLPSTLFGAYPRMRGGTVFATAIDFFTAGLSPHARGNLALGGLAVIKNGPIPACAGEPKGHT